MLFRLFSERFCSTLSLFFVLALTLFPNVPANAQVSGATLSGTVTARHVDAGETVETGDAVVTVADLQRLRVDAEADEADAGALAVGAPVAITADGYPGKTWNGRVEEVADSVTLRRLKPQDPSRPTDTRLLAVKVAFDEPSPLRLGTTVELKIRAAAR